MLIRISLYLKNSTVLNLHLLQDPANKQWFTPDKKMAPVFGEEKIKAFGMAKYLKEHLSN